MVRARISLPFYVSSHHATSTLTTSNTADTATARPMISDNYFCPRQK